MQPREVRGQAFPDDLWALSEDQKAAVGNPVGEVQDIPTVQATVRPMDWTQAGVLWGGGHGNDSDIPVGVRGVVWMAEGAKIEEAQVCRMRVPCSPKGLVDGNLCPLKQST